MLFQFGSPPLIVSITVFYSNLYANGVMADTYILTCYSVPLYGQL